MTKKEKFGHLPEDQLEALAQIVRYQEEGTAHLTRPDIYEPGETERISQRGTNKFAQKVKDKKRVKEAIDLGRELGNKYNIGQ